jgi:hypothetical protein
MFTSLEATGGGKYGTQALVTAVEKLSNVEVKQKNA